MAPASMGITMQELSRHLVQCWQNRSRSGKGLTLSKASEERSSRFEGMLRRQILPAGHEMEMRVEQGMYMQETWLRHLTSCSAHLLLVALWSHQHYC